MPNWERSYLEVIGNTPEAVSAVRKVLEDEEGRITFDHLAPMPEILKRTVSPRDTLTMQLEGTEFGERPPTSLERFEAWLTGAKDWYSWACTNWSTKWGPSDRVPVVVSEDGCKAVYQFETPWGPPSAFYNKLYAFIWKMRDEEHDGDDDWDVEIRPWSYHAG